VKRNDLMVVAKHIGLKKPEHIIDKISSVIKNWNEFAEEQQVSKTLRVLIKGNLITL
jgi:hypothetical protein